MNPHPPAPAISVHVRLTEGHRHGDLDDELDQVNDLVGGQRVGLAT